MKFTVRLLSAFIFIVAAESSAAQVIDTQPTGVLAPSMSDGKVLVAEELAAIVGNAPIMMSEIERIAEMVVERRKKDGVNTTLTPREEAFETLLLQRLLAQRGKADSIDKEMNRGQITTNVETQVNQMIQAAGSVKALERAYGKAIFLIKKDLAEQLLEQQIAQEMQAKVKREVKVSSGDVDKFFSSMDVDSLPPMPPQYIYAQIVKSPPQTEERKFKIREQLLDFRQRIISGEAKLSVLARLYSQDPGSAKNGGEYAMMPIQQLVGPFAEALDGLKPGQLSEVVETEYGFHIMELIDRKGDMVNYRHILLKPEFTVEEIRKVTHELDSISAEIRDGKTTFAQAALKNSDDAESRENGGTVYNIREYHDYGRDLSKATTRFLADQISVEDFRNLVNLQPGEISAPFEAQDPLKGHLVYKIVTLREIIPTHQASLSTDYDIISQVATMDKQERGLDAWVKKAIGDMYVYISPKYRVGQFQYPQWLEACRVQELETVDNKLPKNVFDVLYNEGKYSDINTDTVPEVELEPVVKKVEQSDSVSPKALKGKGNKSKVKKTK